MMHIPQRSTVPCLFLSKTRPCVAFHAEFYLKQGFSSIRQHLSYDVYLEVRGEILRTVLCCIVYVY